MFDFNKPEDGSEERYNDRRLKKTSPYKYDFLWLVHNCVAHPLIGILPYDLLFQFHDWTSRKLNGE